MIVMMVGYTLAGEIKTDSSHPKAAVQSPGCVHRYRILWPVKTDNMLWWAAVLMFIGASGFNISNIALVLLGDVPLDLSTRKEVC